MNVGSFVVALDHSGISRPGLISGSKDDRIEVTFQDSAKDSIWTPTLFSGEQVWFDKTSTSLCLDTTNILLEVFSAHYCFASHQRAEN